MCRLALVVLHLVFGENVEVVEARRDASKELDDPADVYATIALV